MRHLIALALLFGCQPGHDSTKHDVEPQGSASLSFSEFSEVPKLPASPSGAEELTTLDAQIANNRSKPEMRGPVIGWLRERAGIRGALEDYVEAVTLARAWVESSPSDENAWRASFESLLLVHRFADARAALEHVQHDREELAAALSEATGDLVSALAFREKKAHEWPRLEFIAHYAASLGASGKLDDAFVEMKKAAAAARDNPPQLFAWFLFQWGRLLELKGDLAAARKFYEASRARMVTLEATVHLIQVMNATGAAAGRQLATEAVAANPYPELLALAGRTDEARAAWEKYLAALPEAFGDHAARFFLANGNPGRALELARANLANRDTREARQLLVEAALAANDPKTACEIAPKLAGDPLRAAQFLAWRAFSACHDDANAAKLARALGI